MALAILLAAAVDPGSPASRVSNLDLSESPFRDSYIIRHKTQADRCFVVDRRDATWRRSDDNQPGRKWSCLSFPAGEAGSPLSWFVHSKRKGSVFFVPVQDVADWRYPFLYAFVRDLENSDSSDSSDSADAAPRLPIVEWTQLYVSRIYQGLYLRVELPFDLRKKDGGSGVLRDLLVVEGNRVSTMDTRLDDAPGVYARSVAEARLPELSAPSERLAWLAARAPTSGTTLLMSNQPPHRVRLLPLPISLTALHRAKTGRAPASFLDDRVERYSRGAWRDRTSGAPPFEPAERAEFERGFQAYVAALAQALALDASARGVSPPSAQQLKRLAALSDLQLEPGEQ